MINIPCKLTIIYFSEFQGFKMSESESDFAFLVNNSDPGKYRKNKREGRKIKT